MSAPLDEAIAAQARGADPDAHAFVMANAGSGKTRVLVDRTARLLLREVRPDRILCLTFTKAAASEMQDRLYRRLGEWAIAPDETLRADLAKLTGETGTDLSLARRLFARALDTPGGLKVQTIHAFCERLLRNFPMEAGLQPGFAVLEQAEEARLSRAARRRVAEAATRAPGGPAARAFAHLAAARSDTAADSIFGWIAGRRHDLAARFAASGGAEAVIAALRAKLGLAPGETAESIVEAAWAETPGDRLRAAAAAMKGGGKQDQTRAALLEAALEEEDAGPGWALYLQAVRTGKGERYAGGLCSKAVGEAAPDIVALFGDKETPGGECARIDAVQDALKAARCAELSAAALTLAEAFIAAYEAGKAVVRGLDFSDLIHRALGLLEDSEARDWVRYKLDGGVDHILVDEAQDNSPEQWRIVDAAAAEFFTGLGAREALRTLFAVGDEKQSIFGFQGAAPAEFRRASQRYSAQAREARQDFHAPPLETSFRSAPAILKAVDAVFDDDGVRARMAADPEADLPEGEAETMRHLAFRQAGESGAGCVELWPPLPAAEPAEDGDPAAPVDAERADSPRTTLARMIAARIRDMIAAGAAVWDKDDKTLRAMRPGDALILVRRRDAFFEEMIRQLKLHGLPVAGADRLTLTEQAAVQDLLALARFALLPEDDLSLAELLKSPFFQPAGDARPAEDALADMEDALFALAWEPGGRRRRLWAALRASADPRLAEAKAVLEEARARVGVDAPYDFFCRFLNRMAPEGVSFQRRLLARLGPEAEDPVEEFLARALKHQHAGAPSLQRFAAELEAERAEIAREMEAGRDEIRVMTVHGAKGLEAPLVVLPDTTSYQRGPREEGLFPDDECGLIWSPRKAEDPPAAAALRADKERRDDAEYLRLLYVALTRARDHLIVAGWRMGPRGGQNPDGRIDAGCWHDLAAAGLERAGAAPCETPAGPGLMLGAPAGTAERAEEDAAAAALPAWAGDPAPAEQAARAAAPSHLLSGEGESAPAVSPLSAEREQRYLRGSLIHKLLELLPELEPARRAEAARAWLARQSGADEALRADVQAAALTVLDDPAFAHVFGPDSRAEVPVAGTLPGGAAINGAVDRLVVQPDTVLVVDFKTNRPPPETIAGADPAYIAQMAAYRAVLMRVFPGREVRCALLWTDGPHLMEVPAAAMDAALAEIASA